MTVNLWLALSTAAKDAINTRLNWDDSQGEYSGPVTDTEAKIFQRMIGGGKHGTTVIQKMFKTPTFQGKTWHLYSLTFPDAGQKLKDALDYLAANRANNFRIVGAWNYDTGSQVRSAGEIVYPIPSQALEFMPDIITRDQDGNIISTDPATELTDVNIEQGQAPRLFT